MIVLWRGGLMDAYSKLVTMREAIARHLPSRAMVLMCAQLEQMMPFAAAHEVIRQGRRDLTLVAPSCDALVDQMIGAGCVSRVMTALADDAPCSADHCLQRAVEKREPNRLATVEYSNTTLALALHAGALGVPFLPTYSTLGSDLLKTNGNLREFPSPVSEENLVAVRALRPDVAVLHVQRADAHGNAHLWGSLGVAVDGARASRKVIIVAEEIVDDAVIASDPNRTLVPDFLVAAVVHEPWGAHPSAVPGHYRRDDAAFSEYDERSRRAEDFERWLVERVLRVEDRREYMRRLVDCRAEKLAVKEHSFSATADYGD
jgi:glutaconate CoA-transferase, subunit A